MGYSRSRARCVPLQYPSSATRGVKQALDFNKKPLLNQNLIVVSSPFEEKKNSTYKALNSLSQEFTDQVSQSESGMFYELSSKKRMECEKYQDCSWFHSSPMKSECNNKLSLAETFDSFIETDEFDLPMQYANSQISPWGDEYLEVFTDDILPEENYKLGEKNKNCFSDENFNDKCKEAEESDFDSYNVNFTLKKTDSTDSMKNISSTNPAEIIPISFKERLNNSNYGLAKLGEVKNEIKEEIELYSPESNSYLLDSDDSDLNIGREETVEEMDPTEDFQVNSEKKTICLNHIKSEIPALDVPSDCALNKKSSKIENNNLADVNFKTVSPTVQAKNSIGYNNTNREKLDLNFDIAKLTFEQSLNVNTPDLDFMDLVDFINEEMRQENNLAVLNSVPNISTARLDVANQDLISESYSEPSKTDQPRNVMLSHPSSPQNQLSVDKVLSTDSKSNSTVDFNEVTSSGYSIAERIKTTAKRKTRRDIKDLIDSEEESSESMDEDEDYDYKENISKRKCVSARRRTKSSTFESVGDGKRTKEENSSYRERRDKNNEASRRSRQNRKARELHMYETLEEEEKRNVKLKAEADVLEKQVTSLRQLLLQLVLHKGGAT